MLYVYDRHFCVIDEHAMVSLRDGTSTTSKKGCNISYLPEMTVVVTEAAASPDA